MDITSSELALVVDSATVNESRSEWAFMARVVLGLLVAALALVAVFYRSDPPPAPALVYAAPRETPAEAAARLEAAASAQRLENERRELAARSQRASLREDIYRGLGKKPPESTGKPRAKPTLPRQSPVPLDRKYIQKRIREDFVPLAKDCYETLLAKDPKARGKAVFSFVIVGDAETGGIVESAELVQGTTLTDPEFAYCVGESLLSLSFDPPPNDGWVTVVYPIDFSPDDPTSSAAKVLEGNPEPAAKTGASATPLSQTVMQPRAFQARVGSVMAWGVDPSERQRLASLLEPPLQDCYSKASKSDPDTQGLLTLSLDMDSAGGVQSVHAFANDRAMGKPARLGSSLTDCAKDAARRVRLRNPERWKKADVRVPVTFSFSPE